MVELGNNVRGVIANPALKKVQMGSWPGVQVPQSLLPPLSSYSVVPGKELDFAEVVSPWTTTNTVTGSTAAASLITGLSVDVVGQGQPVDLIFYAPNCYHSVANTMLTFYTVTNGASVTANDQLGQVDSRLTTTGPFIYVVQRVLLTNAVSYNWQIGVAASAAGTTTLSAAGFAKIQLSVIQR